MKDVSEDAFRKPRGSREQRGTAKSGKVWTTTKVAKKSAGSETGKYVEGGRGLPKRNLNKVK